MHQLAEATLLRLDEMIPHRPELRPGPEIGLRKKKGPPTAGSTLIDLSVASQLFLRGSMSFLHQWLRVGQ